MCAARDVAKAESIPKIDKNQTWLRKRLTPPFLVNSAALQFVSIINEHSKAHQTGCAHESTDLLPSCKGNDLQAGKERSLQDDAEKEALERK
jgi:hypothetical protein